MIAWDKTKPTLLWQLRCEGAWPTAVALLPSGKKLVVGNEQGQLLVWDLPEPKAGQTGKKEAPSLDPARQLVGHTNGITRLAALPDGETVASASLDHTVRLWKLTAPTNGTAEIVLDAEQRQKKSKQGDKSAFDQPGIKVAIQTECQVLQGHDDWIASLAVSRDGKQLISGDYRSQVIVWEVATGQKIKQWSGLPWNWIVALAIAPDGKTALVSESRYKRDDFDIPSAAVRLWEIASAEEKLDLLKVQFPKYDRQATSYEASQIWRKFVSAGLVAADFSPDGSLIALGQGGENEKGVVHLLESSTGKLVRGISSHQYGVTDVRFSSDGRFLLSTGRDTTLRVTHVADGKEVLALNSPRGGQFKDWLSAFSLSNDERIVAASDIAGLVHVWQVE